MLVIIFGTIFIPTSGQTTSSSSSAGILADTVQNGCFRIDESWNFCKPWAGLYVDVAPNNDDIVAKTFGLHVLWTNAPAGQIGRTFDTRLRQFLRPDVTNLDVGRPGNPFSSMREKFVTDLNCPEYSAEIRRYFISVLCMQMVDSASQTCKSMWKPGALGLCKSTCDLDVSSLNSMLSNQTMCPGTDASRDSMYRAYANLCTQNGFRETDETRCISGTSVEPNTCGYLERGPICDPALCPEGAKNNPACSSGTTSGVASTKNGSSAKNSGKISTSTIVGIVAGVLVVIILVAVFVYRRSKEKEAVAASNVWQPPIGANESKGPYSPSVETRSNTSTVHKSQSPFNVTRDMSSPSLSAREPPSSGADVAYKSAVSSHPSITNNHLVPEADEAVIEISRMSAMSSVNKRASSLEFHYDPTFETFGNGDVPGERWTVDFTGEKYAVTRSYDPTMPDEMELVIGDIVLVQSKFDDGWAYGLNMSTGQLGVFPLNFSTPKGNQTSDVVTTRHSVYGDTARLQMLNPQVDPTDPNNLIHQMEGRKSVVNQAASIHEQVPRMGGYTEASNQGARNNNGHIFQAGGYTDPNNQAGDENGQNYQMEGNSNQSKQVGESNGQMKYKEASRDVGGDHGQYANSQITAGLNGAGPAGPYFVPNPSDMLPVVDPSKNSRSGTYSQMVDNAFPEDQQASVTALMSLLEQISANEYGGTPAPEFSDQNKRATLQSKLSNLPPEVRNSVMSEKVGSRYSFSALMNMLNDPQIQQNQSTYFDKKQTRYSDFNNFQ